MVGPYEVRGRLGAGGMGVVYLGTDGHRPVAIKIVDARLADDAEFRARFRREITLARRVGGLCTAKVMAADPDANPPYLVTEYIPGPTLAAFVQAGGRMVGQPLTALAVGLAEALVAIHGCGVIHRDLKPGNVLLGPQGPRVVDFGIASATDSTTLTHARGFMGTPGFVSPEQTYGAEATPATDVFAWGATVAFAATGRSVFSGPTPEVMLLRVRNDMPDLHGVDPGVAAILRFALVKDPAARPTASTLLELLLGGAAGPSAVTEILTRAWGDFQQPVPVPLSAPFPAPPLPALPLLAPSARAALPVFAGGAVGGAGEATRTRNVGEAGQGGGSRTWLAGGVALVVIALVVLMVTGTLRVRLGGGDGEDTPLTRISAAGTAPAASIDQPAAAENCASRMPDDVVGRWKGVITQPTPFFPSYPTTYMATLVLEHGCAGRKVGTWDIPEYGCAATIELINPGETVKLAARTVQAQTLCDPEAEVRVQARSDDSLYIELYHSLPATAEPAATGTLSRVP